MHVLVVEDDQAIRSLVRAALNTQGYEVTEAGDGNAAVLHFGQSPFDAVLMDLNMPNMDGCETIRHIRMMPTGKDVPIIVLTALESEVWEKKALAAGATQFLTKPFRSRDLLHCLRTILEGHPTAHAPKTAKTVKQVALQVRYQTVEGFLNCYARNLIDGRSFIETAKVLPVGSTFSIDVVPPDPEKPFRIQAVVKWINLYEENKGMGIAFTFENPEDERRIQDWVNRTGTDNPGGAGR